MAANKKTGWEKIKMWLVVVAAFLLGQLLGEIKMVERFGESMLWLIKQELPKCEVYEGWYYASSCTLKSLSDFTEDFLK